MNYPYMGQTFDEDVPVFCLDEVKRAGEAFDAAAKGLGSDEKALAFLREPVVAGFEGTWLDVAKGSDSGLQSVLQRLGV